MEQRSGILRRLSFLRDAMKQNGYGAVVVAGNTEFQQKGYIRYFADWRLFGGSAQMVVLRDADPILFLGPGAQAEWAKELSAVPDTRPVPDRIDAVVEALVNQTAPRTTRPHRWSHRRR